MKPSQAHAVVKLLLLAALYLAATGTVLAQSALPDRTRTPGAVNPAVTQANIGETICLPGWAKSVRPPESYTEELKRQQIDAFGYADRRPGDYEEDHLIPLELGGAPKDPHNLWPEPHDSPDGWGSVRKDILERYLNHLVCADRLPLDAARRAIARNWIGAYRHYIGTRAP